AINQDEMLKAETGSRNRRRAAYAAAREHQCAFPHLGLNLGADVTVVSQYKSAVVKCLGHGRLLKGNGKSWQCRVSFRVRSSRDSDLCSGHNRPFRMLGKEHVLDGSWRMQRAAARTKYFRPRGRGVRRPCWRQVGGTPMASAARTAGRQLRGQVYKTSSGIFR